jgi:hypothetical protein
MTLHELFFKIGNCIDILVAGSDFKTSAYTATASAREFEVKKLKKNQKYYSLA